MKIKWRLLLMSGLVLGLLSGCAELDELLSKANQILDQQIAKGEEKAEDVAVEVNEETATSENNDNDEADKEETDTNTEVNNESDGHVNEADDDQLFTLEDRIKQGDFSVIDPPNGYPLPPPLDWYLVQIIKDPEDGWEAWEGVFCFDTQLESTIENYEQSLRDDNFDVISEPVDSSDVPDHKHVTKFAFNDPNVSLEGDMVYFIDEMGTACTKVYFVYD